MSDQARVLIVEDNRDTAALLCDLMEAEGYQADSVSTGEGALERLEGTSDVDLVVLDLMLPGMSGYEVIERLRAEPRLARMPVLVLSALSSTSARVRGLRDGADDYMTKPFVPAELMARARTLMTNRLLERRTREIEALDRIPQASLEADDVDALLGRIVEIAAEVVEAEGATVRLADETRAGCGPGPPWGWRTTAIPRARETFAPSWPCPSSSGECPSASWRWCVAGAGSIPVATACCVSSPTGLPSPSSTPACRVGPASWPMSCGGSAKGSWSPISKTT